MGIPSNEQFAGMQKAGLTTQPADKAAQTGEETQAVDTPTQREVDDHGRSAKDPLTGSDDQSQFAASAAASSSQGAGVLSFLTDLMVNPLATAMAKTMNLFSSS